MFTSNLSLLILTKLSKHQRNEKLQLVFILNAVYILDIHSEAFSAENTKH